MCTLFLSLWSTRVHERTLPLFLLLSSVVDIPSCRGLPPPLPGMGSPRLASVRRRISPSIPQLTLPQPSPQQSSPDHPSPTRSTPTNDDIEAVIKMATSSHPSLDRPLRDTRTQLFVGNVCNLIVRHSAQPIHLV